MKYCVEGGMSLLEYDLAVLNEMQDQVREASGKTDKDGKAMMERVKQGRAFTPGAEVTDSDAIELLKQRSIPVGNTGE